MPPKTKQINELIKKASAHNEKGSYRQAEKFSEKILRDNSNIAEAWYNLGVSLRGQNKKIAAKKALIQALQLTISSADAQNSIGVELFSNGDVNESMHAFSQALRLQPNNFMAHANYGNALLFSKNFNEAKEHLEYAYRLSPDNIEIFNNLVSVLKKLNQLDRLESLLMNHVKEYKSAEIFKELGATQFKIGKFEKSIVSFQQAEQLKPTPELSGQLFRSLSHCCKWGADYAQTLKKTLTGVKNGTIHIDPFTLLGWTMDESLHKSAAMAFCDSMPRINKIHTPSNPTENSEKDGKIIIGYFSADFHNHATMRLMKDMLAMHDRKEFEIHAFSFGPNVQDQGRKQAISCVDHFHEISDLGNDEIINLARSKNIDIAIDLKGYTRHARPEIFLNRAAKIQINFLGHPGTFGCPEMDYIIADNITIPPNSYENYSESVITLPDCYQPNNNDPLPEIATKENQNLPNDAFIFCCFNQSYKITPQIFSLWMNILKASKQSVLWLLSTTDDAENNLLKEASLNGVCSERLIFAKIATQEEHLSRLQLADLALDTQPYNSHTTASDALRAGVPLITLKGQSFASRVGESILRANGLDELVAEDAQKYIEIALDLYKDPKKLELLKRKISTNNQSMPLFNTKRYIKSLETAFRYVHKRASSGLKPTHLELRYSDSLIMGDWK